MGVKLGNKRQALTAVVSKFDGLGLPSITASSLSASTSFNPLKPTPGGAHATFAGRQKNRLVFSSLKSLKIAETNEPT